VNAEITAEGLIGAPFAARKWRSARFTKLARLLGLGPPEPPARPPIRHPLDRLVFHNFAIYELYRGSPGRKYMALSNVEVTRKLSFRELASGECEYRFEVNAAPDPVWDCYVKKLLPDAGVRFENRVLVLVCFSADLETRFEQTRRALAWANFWHTEEREALLARISARDEAEDNAREMEENRRLGLKRQFDNLEI
jgi:hypothetical protein